MKQKITRPRIPSRLRYGALSMALLCALLAVITALNVLFTTLEKKHALRVDYSFNALTSYGEKTERVLAGLKHPVHIYALYSRGSEDQPLLELLNRYAAASSLVTWEQTDASLNPALLTKYRDSISDTTVSNNSLIVACEETGRFKVLSSLDLVSLSYNVDQGVYAYAGVTYESSLTAAISYVTSDVVPRVMILQGHGELDENGTKVLASFLSSNRCDVYYFTLNTTETALVPGEDLLMILSPVRDLTQEELDKITAFTDAGGSLFLTCDYTDPVDSMPNYSALLRSYGFLPEKGVVVASADEPATYYNNSRIRVIPHMQSTEITADLVSASDTFLVLAGSRAFAMPTDSDRYLLTEAVLTSSDKSYLRDFSSGTMSLTKQADDPSGPFALALLASRTTATGDQSRAFILGCSTLLTSDDEYAMTVSQEFILRTVEVLLGQESSDLSIMAKAAVRPALSTASTTLGSVIIVLLPMLVLGCAVLVLAWRRRR